MSRDRHAVEIRHAGTTRPVHADAGTFWLAPIHRAESANRSLHERGDVLPGASLSRFNSIFYLLEASGRLCLQSPGIASHRNQGCIARVPFRRARRRATCADSPSVRRPPSNSINVTTGNPERDERS